MAGMKIPTPNEREQQGAVRRGRRMYGDVGGTSAGREDRR
jgi:hypothetical protein